ncbi:NADH-quinone oxidoreductase subunit NuoG [Chromohalobacter israelensis]|uniref:NADH-quinone oxidoreductase n=1 Tax=Chromohalobacter israelensis (strain ATCC BAA-138 / DSM 3043 / CIP 106854 / NCIMB 13768 / 1H11) TaxID=290398 RepID=Q1QST7_CHRI1|nr:MULTISPECIES: NADH-quinone oxidoreductase subunit NuoG [Chromohalobacter]ABE60471.1 NADH dehydrogenase subunit G [Chromohalobacter salexigens DSM 3043]MDF9434593.1 NADH-quinone oxidoreductase subunit NuoG [Chromohalobacter israelensis]PWW39045.1 NADH dehydrogenase subunit G [Chromohalobacter salexigens]
MATIHVDGRDYEVDGADNLLHACLSLGLDIPYFCWHPAMGSVGACRQCAVKQYKNADDTQGMLVMSCMAPVQDDAYISIEDEEAKAFRANVIEWLMINHPHDCPVCEEGGHCHLQDMTVMTGHDSRRYRFRKRTHKNQDLGPFIAHEMNRCITCYRCVRFYQDYAGGGDLGAFGAHDNIYFGRFQEGTLESPFSGNLTEVCPTGVFTDQTHSEHYTRKWDLQFAPSVCHQCAVGCNISPGERYGDIRRIENRYHGDVNHYFLCDRGRFGYGYVNREDRPRVPEWRERQRVDAGPGAAGVVGGTISLEIDDALDRAADGLRSARRVIGIGSPRASLESNHMLRTLVGDENFSTGIDARELELLVRMSELNTRCGLPSPSLREIEACDAVLVLGEDLLQSAARMALAVRQAINARGDALAAERGIPTWNAEAVKTLAQEAHHPLFLATPEATGLDELAERTLHAAPDDIARLGFAVAHCLDAEAPAPEALDDVTWALARRIGEALLAAERPLVIAGGSLGSPAVLEAAGNVARALARRAQAGALSLVRREANSTGLALLGGQSLEWALDLLANGDADGVVVLENDLYTRAAAARVNPALQRADCVVVLDHQRTATWEKADIGLPAASFAESDGTLVSLEGRAQRFYQVFEPSYIRPETRIRESWRWLNALKASVERQPVTPLTLDEVTREVAATHSVLAPVGDAGLSAAYRVHGLRLAREPHRYSGRTAMRANLDVSEPRVPQDPDTPFAFSMEGYAGYDEPRREVAFAWAPGWNSPQAWNKFQDEVGGHLRAGDPGVRLLAPLPGDYDYVRDLPAAFAPRDEQWLAVPQPRLFGGEETSARAEPIQARMDATRFTLSARTAERLRLTPDAAMTLILGERRLTLPVTISATWPDGTVGVPSQAGLPLAAPEWARLEAGEVSA